MTIIGKADRPYESTHISCNDGSSGEAETGDLKGGGIDV